MKKYILFFTAAAFIIATVAIDSCKKKEEKPKTVSVGAQNGTLSEGKTGTVTFTVNTKNIANGNYTASVSNLPAGVSVKGKVAIDNDSGVLTLEGSASTVKGVYEDLRLAIEEATSKKFTLTIAEATVVNPPALSAGTVTRTSDTQATIGFTTDKAGTAYYLVLASGTTPAPTSAAVKAGTSLGAATAGDNTGKAVTLTAGAKDIYVVVEDATGNISAPLKIAVAAYDATDTTPPVLSAGTVTRTSDTQATIGFTTDEAGTAYYLVLASGTTPAPTSAQVKAGTSLGTATAGANAGKAVTLTAGAKDIYVVVEDAAGNISVPLKIAVAAYDPGDVTPPTLSAGSVTRTSDTQATIDFTTDEAGTAYYLVLASGATPAPTSAAVQAGTPIGAVTAGANDGKAVTLTAGAKDIYVVVEDAAGNISAPLKIAVAAYDPGDVTSPVLSAGSVIRTSDTQATIDFTTDEAGTAYYRVYTNGAPTPFGSAVKTGGTSLGAVTAGAITGKSVTLTAGAKDIYVVVEDAAGNISLPLKIESIFVGTGVSATPYQITTPTDLSKLSELINAGVAAYAATGVYYRLTGNINLSGISNFTPIGSSTNPFRGTFDGNEKTISNLTSSKSTNENGLFGNVNGGTIQNLGLINVQIGEGSGGGGIAGSIWNNSRITSCYVSGGKVSGTTYTGGIASSVNSGCEVDNCYTTCTVSGTDVNVGGIAAYNQGTVRNCYATGAISGTNYCGGIVGQNTGTVSYCLALNPSINRAGAGSGSNFGRVVGLVFAGNLDNNVAWQMMSTNSGASFADGTGNGLGVGVIVISTALSYTVHFPSAPTGPWTVVDGKLPGLFGNTVDIPAHIINSFSGGDGTSATPYLISTEADLKKLRELVNAGTSPYADAGTQYRQTASITLPVTPLDGSNWTPIGNSSARQFAGTYDGGGFSIANLTINSSNDNQGLFGIISTAGVVKNVALTVVNVSSAAVNIGGVAGTNNGRIEFCYVTGSASGVSGNGNVGGMVGSNSGTVENCYTICNVTGLVATSANIGGIAGYNGGISGVRTVNKCYATGAINGGTSVGGVVGMITIGASVTNCVALNASVTGTATGTIIGRVIGSHHTESTMSNNFARASMTMTPMPIGITPAHNDKYGANITVTEYGNQTFYTTAATWTSPGGAWSFTGANPVWKMGGPAYPLPALNWQSTYPAKPSHL